MTDLQRVVVRRPGIPKLGSLVVRFLEKVKIEPGGCWLWQGEIAENGRGGFRHPETKWAHRAAYLLFVGPIPEGMTIDHLCYVPACVNPDHLDVVTAAENAKRYFQGWSTCDKLHPETPTRLTMKQRAGREPREPAPNATRSASTTAASGSPRWLPRFCPTSRLTKRYSKGIIAGETGWAPWVSNPQPAD